MDMYLICGRSKFTVITVLVALWLYEFSSLVYADDRHWHHQNVTDLLNNLLQGYDKDVRPGEGGPPTEVLTDLYIKSMGPISEEMMGSLPIVLGHDIHVRWGSKGLGSQVYSMDCYFRQTWFDQRLKFHGTKDELRVSIKMLEKMWKPDTYFLNGRGSYLHTVTYPNKLLRINKEGGILYSMRLTIKATCPMDLRKYPMDNQTCPLYIGSYAYKNNEVQYKWKEGLVKSVATAPDMKMAQFDLDGWFGDQVIVSQPHGNFSVVMMNFELRRNIGYYLLQIYLPCYLIVVISWVSFWINREATPARVTLGITTILTTSTIKMTGSTGVPKVPYNTALDIFLHACFFFVFAAIIEYAGVNYFTKTGKPDQIPEDDDDTDQESPLIKNCKSDMERILPADPNNGHSLHKGIRNRHRTRGRDNCCSMFMECLKGNSKYRDLKSLSRQLDGINSVSKIDIYSRFLFPICFVVFSALYWSAFQYYL
ncbi:gamma-aminobutyric acid receptor alpha-like isoform X2 [Lineus longissimus]|uniref:gamma-aminobutyric acid receptor alpha-like isoform X2 n=1 Tax=Lineus longissimus TaxID=88925 RepID=UPI00315D7F23